MVLCAQRARAGVFLRVLLLATSALAIAGCKHDLKALSKDYDDLRDSGAGKAGGSSGRGGSAGAGRGGSGGSAGSSGSNAADAGGLSCDPCEEPSNGAETLGLRGCCRGALGKDCGLTFGQGTLCLPRMVPGQQNEACSGIRLGGMQLPGCCRPDGRCGVLAEGIGLGCVAREEIAPALGAGMPAPMPIACEYSCEGDEDCSSVLKDLLCSERTADMKRVCVPSCQRDADCRGEGELCTLTLDVAMNRAQNTCTEPIGDQEPGAFCSSTADCLHNVCLQRQGGANYCSQLCRNPSDCPSGFRFCVETDSEAAPPDGGMPPKFKVCRL